MTVARQYWKLLPSLWLALCPACDGCSKDAPKPPNASPALNSGEFVAPGADGYGKAAGLRFLEVIKGAATPTDTLPLAVFLHGYGEGINDVWLDQVDVPMRVVMFESPRTFKGHFTWMYSPIGPGTSDWLAHTVKVAGEEVAQALRVLTAHRPTQGRVILAGFSQGSVVAFYVTTYHPELVHGAAPIAGLLPKPLWPQSLPGTGPWPNMSPSAGLGVVSRRRTKMALKVT